MPRLCRHWFGLLSAVALAWAGGLGCNLFPLAPLNGPRPDRETIPGTPSKFSTRVSQFLFLHDFDLPKNQPVFRELSQLREQVHKELQLPSSNNLVQVFLFEDRDRYERFMQQKYPDLPRRRAFFVAQPRRLGGAEDLLVYTYWGDKVQQDLRHELTHAMLHSVLKDVPLWLDEGLAEYFEMPPGWNGVNYQHVEQLLRSPGGKAKIDLDRLEGLTDVQQMTPAEYREAWAWTHFMLKSTPQTRQVLIGYLHELRTNSRPGPLRPRLDKVVLSLNPTLDRHLTDLDLSQTRSGAALKNP